MSFFARLFGEKKQRRHLQPLYGAIVAAARDPAWYRDGGVPDTLDGRFDMVAAMLTLVLLRLERDGERGRNESVLLTETFIADMDGSIRQMGIGDLMVGKHVGKMMSALGGRLTAFRAAADGGLDAPVARNIFHDSPPSPNAVRFVASRLERFRDRLMDMPVESIIAGEITSP